MLQSRSMKLTGQFRTALALLLICSASPLVSAADPPSPEKFLGHRVGEDRVLVAYPKVLDYIRAVAETSGRVSVRTAGRSTLGNEMLLVFLTSEANQQSLDSYRDIARQLARPDNLSDEDAERLIHQGKAIVLVTATIHSTEVGATQMAMEFVHEVATTDDPSMLRWLDDVILILMPSINPDGQVMVAEWYEKYLGSEYEGGRMPWLYHHYVGHDNNRDYYMLTQKETRVVNDVLYDRWFPQVFLDEHQMWSTGPRMFVPPQTDPVDLGIDSLILRHADLIGTSMALRLEEAGKRGVGSNMIFDSYWPGGTRNTAWWKNVIGLLTEVASARIATPIYIEPGELRGGIKGLPEYGRRANYLSPWTGGWWRLRDIIDYEIIATRSLLETASVHREDLLRTFYRMNRQGIDRGRNEPPYAFVVPADQHDPVAAAKMVRLLLDHQVRVEISRDPITFGQQGGTRTTYPSGTYVIRASQPYRPFLLTMLEPQRYPEVPASVGGPMLPPYDITSWSLPVSMGVHVVRIDQPLPSSEAKLSRIDDPVWPGGDVAPSQAGYLLPHSADSTYQSMNSLLDGGAKLYWLAGGGVYVPGDQADASRMSSLSRRFHAPVESLTKAPQGKAWHVRPTRVGLYKPWVASMDEGWTRWLLEQYGFTYSSLTNETIKNGSFSDDIDVLLLPDVDRFIIKTGAPEKPEERRRYPPLPPEYSGGLDTSGGERIADWVKKEGGVVVALDSSTEYLIDLFELPVTNVLAKLKKEEFYCPGSMLRLEIDTAHPAAFGMRAEEAGYFAGSMAFQTMPPDARFRRRVVASYPAVDDDVLVSGYLLGADHLRRKAAVVDVSIGKGRLILIGFKPQNRAQPHRTFKLLFNSLYLAGLQEISLP